MLKYEIRNKIIKQLIKLFSLFGVMGVAYYFIEVLWRGYSSWEMIIVGGICALTIGLIDEIPKLRALHPQHQNLLAVGIVLLIEFVAGLYLNIHLGKGIWDYSTMPFNLMGQICLLYAGFWYLLCPFGFWLDNWLRWKLFNEEKPKSLREKYSDLFQEVRR